MLICGSNLCVRRLIPKFTFGNAISCEVLLRIRPFIFSCAYAALRSFVFIWGSNRCVLHVRHVVLNSQFSIFNSQFTLLPIPHSALRIWAIPQSAIRNHQSAIRNHQSAFRTPHSAFRTPHSPTPYFPPATNPFTCISPPQPSRGQAINWPSWSSRTGKRLPHQGHGTVRCSSQ